MSLDRHQPADGNFWQFWFPEVVRLIVAPLVCLFIGFFTADFLLSGVYTWPRTSRAFALTATAGILAYEFVFKEQRQRSGQGSPGRPIKALIYSCLVPYAIGFLALLTLAGVAL